MKPTSSRVAAGEFAAQVLAPAGLVLLGLGLPGCGFGTAAAVGSSGGGGSSNGPPSMSGFDVLDPVNSGPPKTTPAEIHFVLTDAEDDPATVEFLYQVPGQPQESMAHLPFVATNPVQLPATRQGSAHSIVWDFAAEDLLPDDASFIDGVLVYVKVNGAAPVPGTNEIAVGLGNDPPRIDAETPPAEVEGVVPVRLHMSDSSSDAIRIRVEYDVQGDDPDQGWRIARPAGLLPGTPTPEFAFDGIVADAQGSDVVFFWDTDFIDDLHDLERDVQLRFTPIDPVVAGVPALTSIFRVDNNAAPILQLHADALLANPDSVRGIPVPITVLDEESDEVTVVFQWRREEQAFPDLPDTPAGIEAVLADPDQRREHHVCSPYPLVLDGRARPIDDTHVRLPELAARYSHVAPSELIGRELEFPRPVNRLELASDGWGTNPLTSPVAALPARGGTHALVLDAGAVGWRFVEVDLHDGSIERTIATGAGVPTALCSERGEERVLVAHRTGSVWGVDRIALATGVAVRLVGAADGEVEQGAIRGIASLGANAALVTVGSSLVRADWTAGRPPLAVTVRSGLATPWGIAIDPLAEGWAYLAENTAPGPGDLGRVVAVDLHTWALRPIVVAPNADDGHALPRPRGLALLRNGSRLLAVCEPKLGIGTVEVRGVDLGGAARSSAFVLESLLDWGAAAIAARSEGDLLAVTSFSTRDLLVAGGVRARGTILAVEGDTVTLARALPAPIPLDSPWRVAIGGDVAFRAASSPAGVAQAFTWDSSAVPGGGTVFLRATPIDAEIGPTTSMTGPKRLWAPFHEDFQSLGTVNGSTAVTAADLDGDGDLDVASADSGGSTLVVLWQTTPGVFDPTPTVLGGESVTLYPMSIQAADLDGNGYLDLLSANYESNSMTVFLQTAAGTFDPDPIVVGDERATPYPTAARAADLDGDGDLDLVSANGSDWRLSVFRQTAPLVFDPVPELLGIGAANPFAGAVEAADVDADGDLDLVSSNPMSGTLTVYWQTAAHLFDPVPTTLGEGPETAPGNSVQLVDFDGDGDLDVLASDYGMGSVASVFWQSAPGVFEPQPSTVPGSPFGYTRNVRAADMDGDGDFDLLGGNDFGAFIVWQTAAGRFDPDGEPLGAAGTPYRGYDLVPADVDGDGDLDLVATNQGTIDVGWQTGRGTIDTTPTALTPLAQPFGLQAVDLDADSDLDLVCAVSQQDHLAIFWQLVPGTFDPNPTFLGGPATTPGPGSLQVLDVDGDGAIDLVCANWPSQTLTVFWQTAPGVFDPVPTFVHIPGNAGGLQAKDIDGDGLVDLACTRFPGRTILVFWQTAPRVFDPEPTTVGGALAGPYGLMAEDVDGDEDQDLVFVSGDHFEGSVTIGIFWQTAPRIFEETPTQLGGNSTTLSPRVVLADVDGDGDLDVASGNMFSHTLTVFWQESPGEFDPVPTTLQSVQGVPYSLLASDVDDDGDMDLVSVGDGGYNLSVYWHIGPHTFDPAPTVLGNPSTLWAPRSVEAVDFDHDGDLDLLSRNTASESIFWQTSPGSFDPQPTTLVDGSVLGQINTGEAVDLDRDGERDLLFATQSSGLRIYWAWRGGL